MPIHLHPIMPYSRLSQPSRAVTPRTKMIIVNTPHNPVGKVFSREELEQIAVIAEEHNLLVMSDEVVSIALHPRTKRVADRQWFALVRFARL